MPRLCRDAVNERGGDVTVLHLPGLRGNTHFPLGSEQRANCGPDVRVVAKEEAGQIGIPVGHTSCRGGAPTMGTAATLAHLKRAPRCGDAHQR
jgi:hypothetical protein